MAIEDTVVGLVGGFIISILTWFIAARFGGRAERKERLREHVRVFFPILKELRDDLGYAISMKMRNGPEEKDLNAIIGEISTKLDSFKATYARFRNRGLEPEVESTDSTMAYEIKGLFILCKMNDRTAIPKKLYGYHSKVSVCLNLIESYLKK